MHNRKQKTHHVESNLLRWLLICLGWLSVVAGVVGLFLPIMPTVPFLLLSAACFARSSDRFHSWLVEHRHLGPLIRDYLQNGFIPVRVRRMAIGMVWISFPASALLFASSLWIRLLLLTVAAAITLYLLRLPTAPPAEK